MNMKLGVFLPTPGNCFGIRTESFPFPVHLTLAYDLYYRISDRSISIGNEEIIIISESATEKEIQTYLIEDIEVNNDNINYQCKSRDGNFLRDW